jgi:hypothetical protein
VKGHDNLDETERYRGIVMQHRAMDSARMTLACGMVDVLWG